MAPHSPHMTVSWPQARRRASGTTLPGALLRRATPPKHVLPVLLLAVHFIIHTSTALAAAQARAGVVVPGVSVAHSATPLLSVDTLEGRLQNMKVLHEDARIFLFENFLTSEECDAIIALAEPRLEPSVIVNAEKSDAINGTHQVQSTFRTSWGMFFDRGENDVVRAVEERIAAWTHLPVHNGEGVQVLRYQQNQHYGAHWDYFRHKDGISNGGNRYATVLTYLSDVEEGGETAFPFIPAPGGENKNFSECARHHLAVKPRKGAALLFHSVAPNGAYERRSQHEACPVLKGEKWAMTKWIHVSRYAVGEEPWQVVQQTVHPIPSDKPQCADNHTKCDEWALAGECSNNPTFMLGSGEKPGYCLFACRRCDIWLGYQAKHVQPPPANAQLQQARPADGKEATSGAQQQQQQSQAQTNQTAPGSHNVQQQQQQQQSQAQPKTNQTAPGPHSVQQQQQGQSKTTAAEKR